MTITTEHAIAPTRGQIRYRDMKNRGRTTVGINIEPELLRFLESFPRQGVAPSRRRSLYTALRYVFDAVNAGKIQREELFVDDVTLDLHETVVSIDMEPDLLYFLEDLPRHLVATSRRKSLKKVLEYLYDAVRNNKVTLEELTIKGT